MICPDTYGTVCIGQVCRVLNMICPSFLLLYFFLDPDPNLSTSFVLYCSETTLTGESRFHISPPRGFEPESLVTGSKQVFHWTSETWWEWSEIAGSPQGSPPAADSVGCEAGRRSVKPGQKSCLRSSGIITLSARGPSDRFGTKPAVDEGAMMINHVGVTNVARQR